MTAHVCTTSWYNNFFYKVRLLAIKYIRIFVMTVCGVTVNSITTSTTTKLYQGSFQLSNYKFAITHHGILFPRRYFHDN